MAQNTQAQSQSDAMWYSHSTACSKTNRQVQTLTSARRAAQHMTYSVGDVASQVRRQALLGQVVQVFDDGQRSFNGLRASF